MNATARPRVSVLMTTYNGGPLVRETIDSIRAQTLPDWELIVVDDCSTDATFDIVTRHTAHDERIRVFRNDTNLGISETRNRTIGLARGDYIAPTDQDDLSRPERLQAQVDYLDRNPGVVMVATAASELRGTVQRAAYPGELRSHLLAWRLFTRCSIVHSSVCMRRAALDRHGLRYEQAFHYAEDFVLFHKLSRYGDLKILPDELVVYRETPDNASSRHCDEMTANGKAFLRSAFREELGLELTPTDIDLLWNTFNAWRPAGSEDELLHAGRLYAQGLDRFCAGRTLTEAQAAEVREFGSGDWWRAVAAYCGASGRPKALKLFRVIAELSGTPPAALPIASSYVKAWLKKGRDRIAARPVAP